MKSEITPIINHHLAKQPSFFRGLFFSILLHIVFIGALIGSFLYSPPIGNGGKGDQGEAIQAIMVNTQQMIDQQKQKKLKAQQEQERLAKIAYEKAQKEAQEKKALEEKIRHQQEEQQRLEQELKRTELERQQAEVKAQQAQEEKRQAMEKAKEEEQQRLALEVEKKRLETEKARIAKLERERLEQEAKIQQEKRIAEEKAEAKKAQELVAAKEKQRLAKLAKQKAQEEQEQMDALNDFFGDTSTANVSHGKSGSGIKGEERCASLPGSDYLRKICVPLMNNFAAGSRQQEGQKCEVKIHIGKDGRILGRESISGPYFVCSSALSAVDKTRELPAPPKGKPRTEIFIFKL